MGVTWVSAEELIPSAIEQIKLVDVVLDIGCGIKPQNYIRPITHICCEPFCQYVVLLQKAVLNEKDRVYIVLKATWAEILKLLPPKSVDTVFLLDVIEHLEKEEGIQHLKQTETIARRQIVIFTPLGFYPQTSVDGKDNWGLDGGEWQRHKSGWQPEDFDSWNVFAAKEFHVDKKSGLSYGALWAIKNIE